MKNKKVYVVIEAFTTKEINKCRKFIKSPYFNKNDIIIHLFNFIVSEIKLEEPRDLEDNEIWNKLEPTKTFNSVRLRKYFPIF